MHLLTATEAAVKKVEKFLAQQQGIDNYVAYVGTGSPRFYLPLDQQLPQASFAQFVVLASSLEDRNEIRRNLSEQNSLVIARGAYSRVVIGKWPTSGLSIAIPRVR